jgi:uncharacterized protein YkwD
MRSYEKLLSAIIFALVYVLVILSNPANAADTLNGADTSGDFSALEHQIMIELNLARTHPRQYASNLIELRRHFKGRDIHQGGNVIIETKEGVPAVDEAISFLRSVKPCPPLKLSEGMSWGAGDHVREQGPAGVTGHDSADGKKPWDRVSRYGKWQKTVGENISYGSDDARMVVMGLIIDDGVPDRGHRKNIFNPEFHVAGVACGPHAVYGTMCVMIFAGGYLEN